jgi:polysaccharide biosynthesis protein PslE
MATVNLELWLEMVSRHRGLVLGIWLLMFGSIALGSIVWPPSYDSTAEVLVQSDRAQLLVSPGLQENSANQPAVLVNPVSEQDLNSEVELLSGRYLIELALSGVSMRVKTGFASTVLRPVTLVAGLPGLVYTLLHGERQLSARERWALDIAHHLSISVIKRSNVIEVTFRSHDARWSRDFLSGLLNRYLELHARLSQDPQAEKFFEAQRMLLRERLKRSEEVLTSLQLQTGISHVEEQKQALITQLYAAEADYRKTNAQLAAALEQLASLQTAFSHTPERVAKERRLVQNLALGQIKPQVLQLEAERAELLSRYLPSSARIVETDAKLAAARKILERENHTEVQESTTDLNPTWTELSSELSEARADADSLKASQAAQAKQLEQVRGQLRGLTSDGVAIQRAQLQVDSDKEAYVSYVRKSEEARASRALNQNKILNVSVVEQPTLPLVQVFPNLNMNLLAGSLVALMVALGAAHWAEQHDPKLSSIAAITEAGGIPTIAVVNHRS